MMKEKILVWKDGGIGFLGNVGDSTSHPDYHVGDIIAYKNPYSNEEALTTAIICKENGKDFPMGLLGDSVLKLCKRTEVVLVVGYENVTNSILSRIESSVKIKEVEVIEMTQNQIEEELGYRIKIVGSIR